MKCTTNKTVRFMREAVFVLQWWRVYGTWPALWRVIGSPGIWRRSGYVNEGDFEYWRKVSRCGVLVTHVRHKPSGFTCCQHESGARPLSEEVVPLMNELRAAALANREHWCRDVGIEN